jgi:hypothetical protein
MKILANIYINYRWVVKSMKNLLVQKKKGKSQAVGSSKVM